MDREKNLQTILRFLKPKLHEGSYVFCVIPQLDFIDLSKVVCLVHEEEGYTLVLRKELAEDWGLVYDYEAAWIELTVHSSLEAVGLTAAFSGALAAKGISCNVIAGYHHDHLFVDHSNAQRAMETLQELALV